MTSDPDNDSIFGYAKYPKFRLDQPRFPQDTFSGRFLHFLDIIDPRTLLAGDERLKESMELLEKFKIGQLPEGVSDKELWEAKKIKQAIIHPDTGEKIFMPFRMSGFVPFGTPIVVGVLLPNPTMIQTVFWQWLNQSHNACVNYANRNASKPTPIVKFLQGYCAAVSSAVGIAVGLTVLIRRAHRFPPATRNLIQRFVPLPAVCTASTANSLFMRWHERSAGVDVFDVKGNVVGASKEAARRAVRDTAITRCLLPVPIFLLPAALMASLDKTRLLKRNPRLQLPINALACTLAFGLALPASVALFPQISQIKREDLEPELQSGTSESVLFYNKGL